MIMDPITTQLIDSIYDAFVKQFLIKPILFRSPGRVNLIGEHTDYNEGFVLPAAIDKQIIFAITPREDTLCKLVAYDLDDQYEFSVDNLEQSEKSWANYLIGVLDQFQKAGYALSGFNCVFGGNIPIGAGLSSSAAIEAGLAFALNTIFELRIKKIDLVKFAQKAENEFVGVKCGIMDQYINIFGAEDKVVQIDCRSLEYQYKPFKMDDVSILLCDTKIKHSLASSEYNVRREQCENGVAILKKHYPEISSLRDVTADMIEKHKDELDDVVYKRCIYVVNENKRLLDGCDDLQRGDLPAFGKKMYETHVGLSKNYEVSCKELDFLVDFARKDENIFGARMMGGGFGGCTINLIRNNGIDEFSKNVTNEYKKQTGRNLSIYITKIMPGTSKL